MKRVVVSGIVLGRINFGEADRILTVLTPEQGKLRLIAKGVRKSTSKMAGGIELFSISSLTYIPGKRDISTLVSSRLVTHFGKIVSNLDRTNAAYNTLKIINDSTQEECEPAYYELLVEVLSALNNVETEAVLVETWFLLQMLKLAGHEPNFSTDANGNKLQTGEKYVFDFENMAFMQSGSGRFKDQHIKMLRLLMTRPLRTISQIQNAVKICEELKPLVIAMRTQQM